MNYAIIATRLDAKTKKQAQETARELGVPLSVLIKEFLKQLIQTKTVTFQLPEYEDEIPNEYFKRTLAKARKNRKEKKGSPIFRTGEETITWLEKQRI